MVSVPFAVEERSGVITVVDDLKKFSRSNYDFDGVVTDGRDLTLYTNVTLHVVDPKDERTVLMRLVQSYTDKIKKSSYNSLWDNLLGF